jgi:predicted N-acetyltransferase YhbS
VHWRTFVSIAIRALRDTDVDAVNALHNEAFGTSRSAEEFRWEFMEGPYGPAIFVVAERDADIVGTHALIPVRLSRRGVILSAAKDEETLVAASLRGQGLAARLFATTSRLGVEKGVEISFGFSNSQANLRGKARDGHSILGRTSYGMLVVNGASTADLYRYWTDRRLRGPWRGPGTVAFRGLLSAAQGWGSIRRRVKSASPPNGLQVEVVRHADDRLDQFASRLCQSSDSLSIVRSREYLQWRAFADPHSRNYGVLVLDAGAVVGYAVISSSFRNSGWALTDLCVLPEYEDHALPLVVENAIAVAREGHAACVVAWAGGRRNPQARRSVRALEAAGFVFPGAGITCHGKLMSAMDEEHQAAVQGFQSLDSWHVTLLFSQGTM